MVNQVPIKSFDKNDLNHVELASLSEQAHKTQNEEKIRQIEIQINTLIHENEIFHK